MPETNHVLIRRGYPALLSIVIPLYNEEEVLPALVARLKSLLADLKCQSEVVLVNDGSADRTLPGLMEYAAQDSRFKVIALARNFGHQNAATAGLDHAAGDAVVLMDADLQDPPELIHEMLEKYRQGYDVVYARRIDREGETIFKRFTAWVFYRLMSTLVHKDLPRDVGDFRLISRRCLEALKQMQETHRFLRGMVHWVGFPQTAVCFKRDKRAAGSTKYTFWKMTLFAWTAAISFSALPLRASSTIGALLFGFGGCYGMYALFRTLAGLYTVPGWTSVIIVNCLIGGAVMVSIGILGEYVGRIFEEGKARPVYLVRFTTNIAGSPIDVSQARGVAAGSPEAGTEGVLEWTVNGQQ
jgi:glycosyltransferase involved in cell wall biosynthesis